ncbi:MAG TPA: ThiF family adenylyltransferase [Rhodanobacteraceae bacterium]|nr:ThiF family adenylyltransferase [Rhodanobacteraceae bacterium]
MTGRDDRQSFLGEHSTTLFSRTKIAIVGNCGGGSHVAQQLAHIGVGNILLIDPDTVEDVNLNRMVGSRPSDAAESAWKTEVLKRLIVGIQPNASVTCFNQCWQETAEALRDCTAVVGCIDGYAARGELEGYCRRFLLPYVDIGMDVLTHGSRFTITGQVITSLPGCPCMRCMGFLTDSLLAKEAKDYGAAGARPQVIWPNGVLASIAVGQIVRLLTPWHDESVCPYLEYDGNRQRVAPSGRLAHLSDACLHYPSDQVGDAFWPGV